MDFPFEFFVGGFAFDYSTDLQTELLSLFVESDRSGPASVDDPPEEEVQEEATAGGEAEAENVPAIYETSVSTMRQRLEIMGFTDSRWREETSVPCRKSSIDTSRAARSSTTGWARFP